MLRSLLHYLLAIIGPTGTAASQFLLLLLLLTQLSPDVFGRFSFLLIGVQFSWGVWNALFCAPLAPLVSAPQDQRTALVGAITSANLTLVLPASALFVVIALATGTSLPEALCLGAFAAASLLRWYARAYAYAMGRVHVVALSDLVYSGLVLAGTVWFWLTQTAEADAAFLLLAASALFGLLSFGRVHLVEQFAQASLKSSAQYPKVWRTYGRWSLLGVVTTEATANAHVYFVTAFFGAAAFAPLAASAVLIRPVTIAMNALEGFERARMARELADGAYDRLFGSVRLLRFSLIGIWGVTALATMGLFTLEPGLIFADAYDLREVEIAAQLWLVIAALRMLRLPESTSLQAAGEFRSLALASVVSAAVSIVSVLAILTLGSTLWSISGVLLGEAVFWLCTWIQARHWRRGLWAAAGRDAAR